jgi:hypothetical protein
MAHSVTIAEEHESRTAFQERIAQLEARVAELEAFVKPLARNPCACGIISPCLSCKATTALGGPMQHSVTDSIDVPGTTCKACGYYMGRHLRCLNPDCPSSETKNEPSTG